MLPNGCSGHHDVSGEPEFFDFQLVEPVRLLFKDELRIIGKELGLPETIVPRLPFPGTALVIRCLGSIDWQRLEKVKAADEIFIEELAKARMLQNGNQQAFAVLPPN